METRRQNADCLFIAGDLFHFQPRTQDLQEVNALFASIPSTRVIIVSGDHDHIRSYSSQLSFRWSQNVTWLGSGEMQHIVFEDLNTEIYGISAGSRTPNTELLRDYRPDSNGRIRILLCHDTDSGTGLADLPATSFIPYDYAALGGPHNMHELSSKIAWYSGSPEPLSTQDTGDHGCLVGEISPISHHLLSLEFLPLSSVHYIPLQIAVGRQTDNAALIALISEAILKRGSENIYQLKLTGKCDPDVCFDPDVLKKSFRISEILDETEPDYDFVALYKEHASDMIGMYIRKMLKPDPDDMSQLEKKALYYGIHALLRSQKEDY